MLRWVVWAGVDVGGRKKGFHVAVVDRDGLRAGPQQFQRPEEVVTWLRASSPRVIAVDSPRSAAADGALSRGCERTLAREVCGIRYTPNWGTLSTNNHYEWILHGLELYTALDAGGWKAIECFPTASWTQWEGPRRYLSRSGWTIAGLARLGLASVPEHTNQDERDAIAAAVTARSYESGETMSYGDIVVPLARQERDALSAPARLGPTGDRHCLCGCGGRTHRKFVPGHDAKLRSRLEAAIRGADPDAAKEALRVFRSLGWRRGEVG
jgi:predicted nuclease with RNAse H fold